MTDSGEQGRSQPVDLGELPSPSRVVGELLLVEGAYRRRRELAEQVAVLGEGRRTCRDQPKAPAGVDLDGAAGRSSAARRTRPVRPPARPTSATDVMPNAAATSSSTDSTLEATGLVASRAMTSASARPRSTAARRRAASSTRPLDVSATARKTPERDQVVPVLDPQRVQRRDQEPVGQQEGDQGRRGRDSDATDDAYQHHPEQEEQQRAGQRQPVGGHQDRGQGGQPHDDQGGTGAATSGRHAAPVGPAVPGRLRPPAS